MSNGAKVLSVDVLEQLRGALQRFASQAQKALEGAQAEVRRDLHYLEQQLQFWHHEIRRQQEEVTRAKSELARRRWGSKDGSGPGTTDQELALAKAQRRLQHAEEKEKLTRHWLRQLPQDIQDFEGPIRQLGGFLEADVKLALVLLDNKRAALETYAHLQGGSS